MSVETLEVDFKKIIEFLTERRKVQDDWNRKLKAIRLKQNDLIENTLENFKNQSIHQILSSKKNTFSYIDLQQVVDVLEHTEEAKNKNFLGAYNHPIIRDWFGLRRLYQNGNFHIIDLAKSMVQIVQYDIPGLKKNNVATQQQIASLQQRLVDYRILLKNLQTEYEQQCKKNGILGTDVELEVPAMISQLPDQFNNIVNTISGQNQQFLESIEYYTQFTKYACEKANFQKELLILKEIIKSGDIPVNLIQQTNKYQWYLDHSKLNESNNEKITQDKNDTIIIQNEEVQEIDWTRYIIDESPKIEVKSEYIETLLSSSTHRNELIANLNELIYFLIARIESSKQHNENSLLQTFETKKKLTQWKKMYQEVHAKLVDQHFRTLLTLMGNTKTQKRLIEHLQGFLQQKNRVEQNIKNLTQKQADLENELNQNKQQLDKLISEMKRTKISTEKYLSDLIKWRVIVTGDVNKI